MCARSEVVGANEPGGGRGPADAADPAAPAELATVVLLHGLGRGPASMARLGRRLARKGHRVCNLGYRSRASALEVIVEAVHDELDRRVGNAGRLDFVTHSLGGLVLRLLLARHPRPRAGRAVMLAPPNGGSEIVDALGPFGLLDPLLGPLAAQLGTRPEDLPGRLPPPSIPFGVIAGRCSVSPAGWLWLEPPHDGTVRVVRTQLEGMADHRVIPAAHPFLMNAKGVAEQVDRFLRTGRFSGGAGQGTGAHSEGPSGPARVVGHESDPRSGSPGHPGPAGSRGRSLAGTGAMA